MGIVARHARERARKPFRCPRAPSRIPERRSGEPAPARAVRGPGARGGGRVDEAQKLIERGLALKPEDQHFKARLANARLALNEFEGAIEILEGLVQGVQTVPAL